jgi:DNA-binding response OmpR family regulator
MDPTTRLRVLVVDDQPIVAAALRKMLAAESELDFLYCSDPTQAITMAIEFSPTVILQDLVMPGIDGLELVAAFRKEAATRQVPLVVLSSKEDPEVKVAAFARGANDYLVKLPHEKELLARVRYHSTAYRHPSNATAPSPTSSATTASSATCSGATCRTRSSTICWSGPTASRSAASAAPSPCSWPTCAASRRCRSASRPSRSWRCSTASSRR